MKDKLIAILSRVPPGQVGSGPTDEEIVDTILASVRCDTCRHWEQWETSYGECNANSVNMDRLDTQADFFCAKWEPKS